MNNKNNNNDCVFDVEISVNDRNVPLNDFSEKMIARTIFGMLSALKQVPCEDGFNKVEIIIKKEN
jgi:hypothetical protein